MGKKEFGIGYRTFFTASLIYVALPVLLFFMFFLKIHMALIFSLVLISVCIYSVIDSEKDGNCKKISDDKISFTVPFLVITAVFAVIWAVAAGIGEFTWTTLDHNVRAAVLNDLVEYDWPVFYDLSKQSDPVVREAFGSDTVAFAYYFTFWLVPAAVGKLFGLMAARIALVLWSALGLFLVMTGICFIMKRRSYAAMVTLFLFAGFDILVLAFNGIVLHVETTWEGWNHIFNIHGNFYQTMNVFHQTIPGWVVTMLVIGAKNGRSAGALGALLFPYSPWATIGLVPVAVWKAVRDGIIKGDRKRSLLNIFSIGNLILPVFIFGCYALFFTANSNATGIRGFIWEFYKDPGELILYYFLYVIFEFGLWIVFLFRDRKHDGLMWVSAVTLAVFPVYMMSEANDLLMRGTLAPMFAITVMAAVKIGRECERIAKNNNNIDGRSMISFGALLLSGVTAFLFLLTVAGATKEIITGEDTSVQPRDQIVSFGDLRSHEEYFINVTPRQFYVRDYEDTAFYRYLGKT